MEKIRAVKTKTSELINKFRRNVNLAIDAINCQHVDAKAAGAAFRLREHSALQDVTFDRRTDALQATGTPGTHARTQARMHARGASWCPGNTHPR